MDKRGNCSACFFNIVFYLAYMQYIHCFSTEPSTNKVPVGTKTVQCLPNEYGDNCTYCVPKNTCVAGHYTCDYDTGSKVCLPGWSGKSCRNRKEPDMTFVSCPDNQCRNGGSCISGQCCCVDGFTGILCEIEIIECTNTSCHNGGICKDLIGRYECLCKDQYTGTQCEVAPSGTIQTTPHNDGGCEYDTCWNNGTCFEDAIFTYCLCPTWFTGSKCETSLKPQQAVSNKSCPENHYGASCDRICIETDSCEGGHYICNVFTGDKVCKTGWIGENCDTRMLPPQLDPYCPSGLGCKNDGQCDRGRCCCKPDHSGDLCEIQSIRCVSSPCQNNGTCLEGNGSYRCICESDFSGRLCDIDLRNPIISPSKTSMSIYGTSTLSTQAISELTSSESLSLFYKSPDRFMTEYRSSTGVADSISLADVSATTFISPSRGFLLETEGLYSRTSNGIHLLSSANFYGLSSSSQNGSFTTQSSKVKNLFTSAYTFEPFISPIDSYILPEQSSFREVENISPSSGSGSSFGSREPFQGGTFGKNTYKTLTETTLAMSSAQTFITDLSTERVDFTLPRPAIYSELFPTLLSNDVESMTNRISSSIFNSPYNLISTLPSVSKTAMSTRFLTSYSDTFNLESSLSITDEIETSFHSQSGARYGSSYQQSLPYESFNYYTSGLVKSSQSMHVTDEIETSFHSQSSTSYGSSNQQSLPYESFNSYTGGLVRSAQSVHVNSQIPMSSSEAFAKFSSSKSYTQESSTFQLPPYTSRVEIAPSFIVSIATSSVYNEIKEASIYSSKVIDTYSSEPLTFSSSQLSNSFSSSYSLPSGQTNTHSITPHLVDHLHVSSINSDNLSSSRPTDNFGKNIFKESTVVKSINPTSVLHSSSDNIKSIGNSVNQLSNSRNTINLTTSVLTVSGTDRTINPTFIHEARSTSSQVGIMSPLIVTDSYLHLRTMPLSKALSLSTASEPSTEIYVRPGLTETEYFSLASQYGNEVSLISHVPPGSGTESNTLVWWIILIIVLGVVVIGASLVFAALVVMRKRRSDFRAIEQNPEAVLAYDKEHFSFQPDIANPTFEPEDDSDDDSVKHDIYIVNK